MIRDLMEFLEPGRWIALPLAAVREVGPAAQTLAGLLTLTKKGTFVPMADIAAAAGVPVITARRHLATLEEKGWVRNVGRGRTVRGAPRRTCTIEVLAKSREYGDYGILPRENLGLNWSATVILSLVLSRLMSLKAVIDREDGRAGLQSDDFAESVDILGQHRLRFTLKGLTTQLGLSRPSCISGRRALGDWLTRHGCSWRIDGTGAHSLDMEPPHEGSAKVITMPGQKVITTPVRGVKNRSSAPVKNRSSGGSKSDHRNDPQTVDPQTHGSPNIEQARCSEIDFRKRESDQAQNRESARKAKVAASCEPAAMAERLSKARRILLGEDNAQETKGCAATTPGEATRAKDPAHAHCATA